MSERMLGEIARLREELAKVRAKSEERRRLLESGAWNLDDLDRWYCHECTATSYVGPSGTGMPPEHAAGCAVAAALKDE